MRAYAGLLASAAALVFTRVFAATLPFVGFTEHAVALGASPTLAGVAFGAYALTLAASHLVAGMLSDRLGRRPVILAGSLLFVAGAVIAWLATDIAWLLTGRLVQGLGGVASVAMAAVAETVPKEKRATAMALIGVPAGMGAFLGIALGPILSPMVGFAGLFAVTALLGLVAGLPFLRALPPPTPSQTAPTRVVALGAAALASSFALAVVFFDYQSDMLPVFSHLELALALGFGLVGVTVVTRTVDRRGATWLPIIAALALLALAAPAFRLGAMMVAAAAFFLGHAVLSSLLPSQTAGGRSHGLLLVFGSLGTFLGATTAGILGVDAALVVLAFLALAAVALVARSYAQGSSLPPPGKVVALPWIRWLGATCVALTFVLMVVGAWVKATGSGLACPDWPTCYGEWLPPFPSVESGAMYDLDGDGALDAVPYTHAQVMYEWTHRAIVSLIGIPVVAFAILAWRSRDLRPALRRLPLAAVGVLVFQAGLGMVTVVTGNPPWATTSHLAVAVVWFAMLLSATALAFLAPHAPKVEIPLAPTVSPQFVAGGPRFPGEETHDR